MRSILFKLSDFEAAKFEAALDEFRFSGDKSVTTPRKFFLHAVHRVLDEHGVSLDEDDFAVQVEGGVK